MTPVDVQLAADRRRLGARPELLERKWKRMSASPFAFLRGASALWAELLAPEASRLAGVPGEGVLVGDLHLENLGTFRTARGVALHVNDFDETFEGPWTFDVLRLLTSTLLAQPELSCSGVEALSLAEAVLEGHAEGLAHGAGRLPAALQRVVRAAAAKDEAAFLRKRLASATRLVRDEKTPPAPATLRPRVKAAVAQWAAATGQREAVTVVDVTRRIAGTGSLGAERLVALVRAGETPRLLELKEVRGTVFTGAAPSAEALVEALHRCLPQPPREVAAARLGAVPVVVRPLFGADDKLAVDDFDGAAQPQTLHAIGRLAGEVHRRGARRRARWTKAQQRLVLERAVELAGLHAQAFHAFCLAVR